MANVTAKLYIRNKVGYRKPPKRLADLPDGEIYQLFWYCGAKKKSKAVSRFADQAQTALIKKDAELRRAAITSAVPAPEEPATAVRDFYQAVSLYLSEVKRGKAMKTHLAYSITLEGFAKVCKAPTIEAMTRDDVLKYTDTLRDTGLTPRTIANRLAFLKTFFKHFDLAWPMLKTDTVKYTEKTVEAYSLADLRGSLLWRIRKSLNSSTSCSALASASRKPCTQRGVTWTFRTSCSRSLKNSTWASRQRIRKKVQSRSLMCW